MTLDELVALTRRRLAARERRVVPPGQLVRAAVLVPLVDRGEPCLVFAKRTDTVGTHPGQIAFPGGTVDPGDTSVLEAALRETREAVAKRDAPVAAGARPACGKGTPTVRTLAGAYPPTMRPPRGSRARGKEVTILPGSMPGAFDGSWGQRP